MQLHGAAGRTAYLACYHLAQAFIFEDRAKVAKTHSGVQTEFARLTKDNPAVNPDLRGFLSRAYELKSIADYHTEPGVELSAERARAAVETAERFIEHFLTVLERGSPQ